MNSSVKVHRTLLVEANESTLADLQALLAQHQEVADSGWAVALEDGVGAYLRQSQSAGDTPLVVVFGPGLVNPSRSLREVQKSGIDCELVFLAAQGKIERLRAQLRLLPMGGLHWTLAETADPAIGHLINRSALASQRRRQLRFSLDRANRAITDFQESGRTKVTRAVSDHYLASFLAHARDAILAIDNELRIVYWSVGAERLLELSQKEAVGATAERLPFWSDALEARVSDLGVDSQTFSFESVLPSSKGALAIEAVCTAVRDEGGRSIGTSFVIRDVTERNRQLAAERAQQKEMTRRLDSERQYLRSLFKQAPGFIAVTQGPDHVFEVVNDAYLEVVGHRDVLGKSAAVALPEMQGQAFLNLLDQVFTSGKPFVGRGFELSVQRRRGAALDTVFVDFVFQPTIDDRGRVTGIFCQGSDVTQHKLTQEKLAQHQLRLEDLVRERTKELEASQQALQRSQKLEAIGQLTGGVAHDFNNVLQIIASNLQLLQLSVSDPEQRQRSVNAAIEAVDRGTKLSSQLLAFARRQPLQPVSVNLGRVLRGMDDMLRRALGEAIQIETVVAGGLWNTLVDPHQLENVILNLSINARDAMPEGGKLTLELGNAVLDDQYVLTQPDVPPGHYVMLAVSDTGVGMPPEVVERAFDPFFTTKREGEGTGLGLSMTYGFIKQSGGHIRIYSEPGNGTTFKIYLPRSLEMEVELPKYTEGPIVGGSETILIVEDDPAVQEAAVQTLKGLGYQVLRASDGQSALNVLQSGVSVDMLFTDVVMPGPLRSPELARQAKQLFPDLAVLFTSGYTQNAIVHSGRLDPGVELLSKPYRREDLARKVRQVFASSRPVRETAALSSEAIERRKVVEQGRSLAVLVVEDEDQNRSVVCELLNILGHRSAGFASAEEALEALAAGEYDLLLTDINLPGMSGLALAHQATERCRQLGVIIASGFGTHVDVALETAPVILPKPFDLAALQEALTLADARRRSR